MRASIDISKFMINRKFDTVRKGNSQKLYEYLHFKNDTNTYSILNNRRCCILEFIMKSLLAKMPLNEAQRRKLVSKFV